jgi:hypothetical protein
MPESSQYETDALIRTLANISAQLADIAMSLRAIDKKLDQPLSNVV